MTLLVEAAALATAAVAAAWPASTGRVRRHRLGLMATANTPLPASVWRAVGRLRAAPPVAAAVAVAAGALLAGLAGGPVAAGLVAVYTGLGARALLRRRQARTQAGVRAQELDDLADLAAELRAGRPAPAGLAGPAGAATAGGTVRARSAAAVALAGETGAPLADLLEQIEADARAADRAAAAAAAQTAGARTTAVLLAGLPAAGIALGYGIGTDPLHVLLRTPLGAGCAAGSVALQLAGLVWMSRITALGGGA
ncbi:MAG TPA: hypothetical protein VFM55_24270 [Micromonosporaceae bacterium]|nr:hypothetical protein [Micromonosporaceae bacterium]